HSAAIVLAFTTVFLSLFVIQLILLTKRACQKKACEAATDWTTSQPPKQDAVAAYRGFYFPYC
ncbi:hypothetical protein AAVH_40828, partial [Aphelenchoides avenae]